MKEKQLPKISVIMGTYNQHNLNWMKESIVSVLEQDFTDFEFILYDDGSEREIYKILQQYAALDKRIVLIDGMENHGLAYALNYCIEHATGKYIARMDDDDVCTPNRLGVQYRYMEQHPEIDFVGSNVALIDENGIWGSRRTAEYPEKQDFLRYSPYIHPSVMFRKSVLEQVGGYCVSEETRRCEDYELFLRLWNKGYQGYNLQEELLYYREDRGSYKRRSWNSRMNEMKLRGRRFKELGWIFPFGWIYVFRPVIAALVPSKLLYRLKRQRYSK